MVLARLAPSLDSVTLVTPAAVLSKGCKLLKGTLETLRAPPLVSSRSDVKVVDVKNSNRFFLLVPSRSDVEILVPSRSGVEADPLLLLLGLTSAVVAQGNT